MTRRNPKLSCLISMRLCNTWQILIIIIITWLFQELSVMAALISHTGNGWLADKNTTKKSGTEFSESGVIEERQDGSKQTKLVANSKVKPSTDASGKPGESLLKNMDWLLLSKLLRRRSLKQQKQLQPQHQPKQFPQPK